MDIRSNIRSCHEVNNNYYSFHKSKPNEYLLSRRQLRIFNRFFINLIQDESKVFQGKKYLNGKTSRSYMSLIADKILVSVIRF